MKHSPHLLLAIAWMIPSPLGAQLHLLSGSPTPKSTNTYESRLLVVSANGEVTVKDQVASKTTGIWWIDVAEDARKIVILTPNPEAAVIVVDMDQAAVTKRCRQKGGIEQWLADVPGDGPSLILHDWQPAPIESLVHSMVLDSVRSCSESFRDIKGNEATNVITQGRGGVADSASQEFFFQTLDSDGKIVRQVGGDKVAFGFQVPEEFRRTMSKPTANIVVQNSAVMAAVVFDQAGTGFSLLVYRKRDRSWRQLPLPPDSRPMIRGFGRFLAFSETLKRTAQLKESAGRGTWKKETASGPDMDLLFASARNVYPGRLHLYEVESGATYTIATNQGDSEVLLVNQDQVYYRVNDTIFARQILKGSELGSERRIAKSDQISDVHWAFIK